MVSEFRKKKLLHLFTNFFDADSSGTIEKKDFELALERISQVRGWSPSDAKYKEIKDQQEKMWIGMQSSADANNDGQVTKEEWITMWDNFAKNPAAGADWQNLYCKMAFAIQDGSNDGSIDCEEFSSLYSAFGIKKERAEEAFKKMSKGKASVSWDEFQELFKEHFATENVDAPGNFIFGLTRY